MRELSTEVDHEENRVLKGIARFERGNASRNELSTDDSKEILRARGKYEGGKKRGETKGQKAEGGRAQIRRRRGCCLSLPGVAYSSFHQPPTSPIAATQFDPVFRTDHPYLRGTIQTTPHDPQRYPTHPSDTITMTNSSQLFLLADHIKLSLLERQRAVSLDLEPNAQDGEISRSLESLREGITSQKPNKPDWPNRTTAQAPQP
jgi:hypothetical protein